MTALWDLIADPWSQEILRRAFAEVTLVGVAAGALGCWIVLYELSYGAESLAHALLPGLVIAALAGLPLLLGGAAGLAVAGAGVALAGRVPEIGRDTAIAVVVTTLLGLGALLALSAESPPGLGALLFGDILGVTDADLWAALALAAVVTGALNLLHPHLLATGFDRAAAGRLGVRTLAVDLVLLALMSATILVAVRGMGNLLVVAVLVAPAAGARLVTRRMAPMMGLATVIAVGGGLGGIYVSYHADIAAGASVALALAAGFAACAAVRAARTVMGSEPRVMLGR